MTQLDAFIKNSGQCLQDNRRNKSSAIMWATSTSASTVTVGHRDIFQFTEKRKVPQNNEIMQKFISEMAKKTKQILDRVNDKKNISRIKKPGVLFTMVASEDVLSRDWNSPEEDDAWADL